MATLFASAMLAAALVVASIFVLLLGKADPKFGTLGSLGLCAAIAGAAALVGAFGAFIAKRGFAHDLRRVFIWGVCSGITYQLLLFSPLSQTVAWFIFPAGLVMAAGFATARLSELDTSVDGWQRSSPNNSFERTREG